MLFIRKREWMLSPALKCRGLPPEWFYPNKPSSLVIRAKAICSGADGRFPCALRDTCLEYAIEEKEDFGVWGGTSERDRRKIQRTRNQKIRAKQPHEHIYTLEEVRFPNVTYVTWRRVLFIVPRPAEVLAKVA